MILVGPRLQAAQHLVEKALVGMHHLGRIVQPRQLLLETIGGRPQRQRVVRHREDIDAEQLVRCSDHQHILG